MKRKKELQHVHVLEKKQHMELFTYVYTTEKILIIFQGY